MINYLLFSRRGKPVTLVVVRTSSVAPRCAHGHASVSNLHATLSQPQERHFVHASEYVRALGTAVQP